MTGSLIENHQVKAGRPLPNGQHRLLAAPDRLFSGHQSCTACDWASYRYLCFLAGGFVFGRCGGSSYVPDVPVLLVLLFVPRRQLYLGALQQARIL